MTDYIRVPNGIPASGQFDKHTKTEGDDGLLSERTFHDAVTLGFDDRVEAFEKQVDRRITELAMEEFANHPDGLIPKIIVLWPVRQAHKN